MAKVRKSRKWVALLIATVVGVVAIISEVVASRSHAISTTSVSPSRSVLSPTDARSVGFSKTSSPAKRVAVSNEKGCPTSVEAVYEDPAGKSGMISDLLTCRSPAAASAALAAFRRQVHIDRAIRIPSQLGPSAFATASNAPEYIVAWQVGSGIALLAIDTDIAATSTSVTATPLSKSQTRVLESSAVQQNSLYS